MSNLKTQSNLKTHYIGNLKFEFNPPLTDAQSKFVDDIINIGINIEDYRTLLDYIASAYPCIKRLDVEIT